MEVSGQLHASAAVPLRQKPWHPLNSRFGVPQSQSGCSGKDENLFRLESKPSSLRPQPGHCAT